MLALRELQREFIAALFATRGSAGLLDSISADGIPAAERLSIYRNNLQEGFRQALALEFPVMERLVGEDYFAQLTRLFLESHPSRSGDLHHIGGPFANFLDPRFERSDFAYLPDVARLEWAVEESAIAADAPPFDASILRNVAAEDYASLRFELHPSCRLVRSHYPILKIWRANQPDRSGDEVIDLGQGGERVLVRRGTRRVELETLEAAAFAFLEAVSAGFDLAAALEAARSDDDSFDLSGALRHFIHQGVIVRARLPETSRI